MLLSIIGVAIIGIILNIILKNLKPEIALVVNLATCLIIFMLVIDLASNILSKIVWFVSGLNISNEILLFLFKVLGVSYITEFVVDIAEESGSSSIANKVAFAGKVIIAGISLPMLFKLINILTSLLWKKFL